MFNLQVSDVKRLLVDVGSVRSSGQSRHGCQVAAVAAHRLNDEHAPLSSAGRLLDAVARLAQSEEESPSVSVHARGYAHCTRQRTRHASKRFQVTRCFEKGLRTVVKTGMPAHKLHKMSTCNSGTLRPECCPPVGMPESCM